MFTPSPGNRLQKVLRFAIYDWRTPLGFSSSFLAAYHRHLGELFFSFFPDLAYTFLLLFPGG